MKRVLINFTIICLLLAWSDIAAAINPIELPPNDCPPPPDSVQVTVDLGMASCPSLGCEYLTVYIKGQSYNQILLNPTLYNGWYTYTLPWTAVTVSNPKEICVYWHFSGLCTPSVPDKTCCVPYNGSGTYTITCNPCE